MNNSKGFKMKSAYGSGLKQTGKIKDVSESFGAKRAERKEYRAAKKKMLLKKQEIEES